MPEVTRVTRSAYTGRDRDGYSSDDDRSVYSRASKHGGGDSYRTVQRYRVGPRDEFGDRHASRVEVDRRSERYVDVEVERPRSSHDRPRTTVVSERYVERDGVRDPVRSRTVVYDREDTRDSKRPWERDHRPWESDVRETDVRVEKQLTLRRDEPEYEVERFQRETEYYERPEPPPQPIVIRQRAPEPQQIVVQEAPAPPPVIIAREPQQQSYEIIRQERREEIMPSPRRDYDDEYYYRRDTREFDGRKDEQVERYDRRGREVYDRYSDDEDWSRRKTVTRERTVSASPNRKRNLATGALAGAGAAAILAHHKSRQGEAVEHRGRNVAGGAALGAISAVVLERAKGRFDEYKDERSENRSRSSSRSKVKTGLGIAAAALITSAAVKYARDRKANKEELGRGRSRSRRRRRDSRGSWSSYSSVERTTSVHRDPKHRNATIAKAGAATAAAAAVVNHIRSRSRKRNGERSRSKSRVRTGASIVGTGLAGAAVAGLYENRKAKEERRRDRSLSRSRSRSRRSRSRRSRSRARSVAYSDPGVVPGGMVEYGTQPVYKEVTTTKVYDEETDGPSRRRSRRRERRHSSSSSSDRGKNRSRSRLRNVAGGVATTAAAAIGVNQYQKRKEKKERERERERRHYEESPPEDFYSRRYSDDYSPSPPHASGGSFYPGPSSDHVPPQAVDNRAYRSNTTFAAPSVFNDNHNAAPPPIPTYNPQDYAGRPPNGAYERVTTTRTERRGDDVSTTEPYHSSYGSRGILPTAQMPYFPPPPTSPFHEHKVDPHSRHKEARLDSPSSISSISSNERPHNRSVSFAPLSPTSTRRLARKRAEPVIRPESANTATRRPPIVDTPETSVYETGRKRRRRHRRRNSDPSSDRPHSSRKSRLHHSRDTSPVLYSDESEVEILPDRFDKNGRPLDRQGNLFPRRVGSRAAGKESEMVEKIVRDMGDIVDGKKSWKDLLRGMGDDEGSGRDSGRRRRGS